MCRSLFGTAITKHLGLDTSARGGKGACFIIILETKDPRSIAPSGEPQFTDASSDWSIPIGSNPFAMMIRTSPSRSDTHDGFTNSTQSHLLKVLQPLTLLY